jgi:integrase
VLPFLSFLYRASILSVTMGKMIWKTTKIDNLLKDEISGRYYARFWREGKPKWMALKTDIYAVAKTRIAKERKAFNAVTETVRTVETGAATVEKCAKAYLDRVAAKVNIKATTALYYRQIVEAILEGWPELKTAKPKDISKRDLEAWAKRYSEKYSAQRFNNSVDVLRRIFQIAVDQGAIYQNPAAHLEKKRIIKHPPELPTAEQLASIIAQMRKKRGWCSIPYGDLIEFLAFTGCRIKEARNVKWSHVTDDGIWIYGDDTGTKNHERRFLQMNKGLARLLADLKAKPRFRRINRSADFVLSIGECHKALSAACTALGLPHISHHDLRHWFATQAISKTFDVPTVAKWLGHKDGGGELMRTYSHLLQEHSKAMAAKLDF